MPYSTQGRTEEEVKALRLASCHRYRSKHRNRVRASSKGWTERNPGYMTAAYRLRVYGLSVADFMVLWVKQLAACAICRKPFLFFGVRNVHVDHKHGTKEVRGLLCAGCNVRVGHLEHPLAEATRRYIDGTF